MPDFRHVGDFAALELHDVNVVSPRGLMCRRTGTTSQVRADKDAVCAHIVTLCVGRERLQLAPPVRQHGHQAFHPLGIVAERLRVRERFGLCRKGCIRCTELAAPFPTFTSFTSNEKRFRCLSNG